LIKAFMLVLWSLRAYWFCLYDDSKEWMGLDDLCPRAMV
jgi:hypothetical protein